MSAPGSQRGVVRSYQRIFRPDRRIYQVEGRRIPIPGGVPLVWLGYATAALLAVLLLGARSPILGVLLAVAAALAVSAAGDRRLALVFGAVVFVTAQVAGLLLGVMDWPLRLVVLPGLVATLGMQATPDGRPAHRYALSWLWLQVRPPRRWLGRALPVHERGRLDLRVGVAPDHRAPWLRRGRITGPATIAPAIPLALVIGRGPFAYRRAALEPSACSPRRGRRVLAGPLALQDGERLEVRP